MSTSEQPNPKRKRAENSLEEAESTAPVTLVRSDIWYRDGSIILQAENTQFKVYQGVLEESSSVFEDMFSFPQPPLETELVDGCPIVHLSDPAEEVRYILQALCQRKCVQFQLSYV